MGKQLITLCAVVLAAALVVAGCGSDSDTAPISKAEFIKQADAACQESQKAIQEDFSDYLEEHQDQKKATEQDYAELVATVFVPNAEAEVEAIRDLGVPSGDEKKVEALIAAREESIETATNDPQAVINDGEKVFAPSRKLAAEYGLEVCDGP